MKFTSAFLAALVLLLVSCTSEPPARGDAMSIDNPTDADYFIVVDEDTLPLPAHTYIQGFTPVCTGEENITYESGHNPGTHRYRVLDADKKQIFDTSFLSRYRHVVINPTRSTYVEWSVFYGDSNTVTTFDTLVFDSVYYFGIFSKYNSFAIQNESQKDMSCDRGIAMIVETYRIMDDRVQPYMPNASREYYFLRLQDFITAYNETGALTPAEEAEVKLQNLLGDFYENTVENWTHPFRDGEVEDLAAYINSKQYDKAVDLINVNRDFFNKHDAAGVTEMNRLFELSKRSTERIDPVFSPLHIVKYDYDQNGKPYINETIEYSANGECTTIYHNKPVQ